MQGAGPDNGWSLNAPPMTVHGLEVVSCWNGSTLARAVSRLLHGTRAQIIYTHGPPRGPLQRTTRSYGTGRCPSAPRLHSRRALWGSSAFAITSGQVGSSAHEAAEVLVAGGTAAADLLAVDVAGGAVQEIAVRPRTPTCGALISKVSASSSTLPPSLSLPQPEQQQAAHAREPQRLRGRSCPRAA